MTHLPTEKQCRADCRRKALVLCIKMELHSPVKSSASVLLACMQLLEWGAVLHRLSFCSDIVCLACPRQLDKPHWFACLSCRTNGTLAPDWVSNGTSMGSSPPLPSPPLCLFVFRERVPDWWYHSNQHQVERWHSISVLLSHACNHAVLLKNVLHVEIVVKSRFVLHWGDMKHLGLAKRTNTQPMLDQGLITYTIYIFHCDMPPTFHI